MIKSSLQRALRVAALLASGAAGWHAVCAAPAPVQHPSSASITEYQLAPGDVVRVSVFQNPDLTMETRIAEDGTINYPLIGKVSLGASSVPAAEKAIERRLRDGGFIVSPQVTIAVLQVRGNQVTVLGQVAKPGRYPLDSTDARLADVLALAGGIAATGADSVVLTGVRSGKPIHEDIDISHLAVAGDPAGDVRLKAGDMIYVNRAPVFYIYGQVQKPGVFRLERSMTVIQALAAGGGLTPKGTQRGLRIHRHNADGKVHIVEAHLDDPVLPDDVIYVRESFF